MNSKKLFDSFCRFESEYSTFELESNDIHYWDRLRSRIYARLRELKGEAETDTFEMETYGENVDNVLLTGLQSFYGICSEYHSIPLFKSDKEILFWAANTVRREEYDNRYWDVIVDPLADKLDYEYYNIEKQSDINQICQNKIKTSNVINEDIIHFFGNLVRIIAEPQPMTAADERELIRIEEQFNTWFNVDIDIYHRVKEHLIQSQLKTPIVDFVIKQINPRAIIIRYNGGKSILIEAAQRNNIPVIEFQHGVMGYSNPDTSYPIEVNGKITFPNVFFCWGEYWKSKPAFPVDDVRVVGWPFLSHFKKNVLSDRIRDTGKILFISQARSAKSLIPIAEYAAKATNKEVVYRLHPSERTDWKTTYTQLFRDNNIIVDAGESSLYEQFVDACLVVGTNSTALLESMHLGIKTAAFSPENQSLMNWHDLAGTDIFNHKSAINKLVNSTESVSYNTNPFFESEPMKNIHQELSQLI